MIRAEIKAFIFERFMLLGDLGATGVMLFFWKHSIEREDCDKTMDTKSSKVHLGLWHFSKRLYCTGTATKVLAQWGRPYFFSFSFWCLICRTLPKGENGVSTLNRNLEWFLTVTEQIFCCSPAFTLYSVLWRLRTTLPNCGPQTPRA